MSVEAWIVHVEAEITAFATKYRAELRSVSFKAPAAFEIGCFHALLEFYQSRGSLAVENLQAGEFRYLTSPNGNPNNFSFVRFVPTGSTDVFEIRQQVRIRSHWNDYVMTTPDIVVIAGKDRIEGNRDPLFAGNRRKLFYVAAEHVKAAHECKSLVPFPELLVGFVGMFFSVHSWHNPTTTPAAGTLHLAPTLFVGGTANPMQRRMAQELMKTFPVNIVTDLHRHTFSLGSSVPTTRTIV